MVQLNKLGLWLSAFGTLWLLTSSSPVTSTVTINTGSIIGNHLTTPGVLEFLGVPFAAPPVEELRWKPPQPAAAFRGTKNAAAFGPSCYGFELGGPSFGPESEDCLTVNVWTGAQDTGEKRPVMVWIYGGGFEFGTSSEPTYNGTNFAESGVVLVTFNYRLGVFGFLALSQLDGEGSNSGNFGLQDQLAALQWVRDNIVNFGGDPDNITIFGESAGAHSVGLLLASPLSCGLFHKAIFESGAYWESEHGSIRTFDEARSQGEAFLRSQGVQTVKQLRSVSATQIRSAALWNSSTDPGITAFAASIDKYVVPVAPSVAFDQGRTQKVPILAGFNADEQALFLSRALPHNTTAAYRQAAKMFFAGDANQALQLYPGDIEAHATNSADELIGDLVIRQQTWEALDRQASVAGQTCYGYYFTYTSSYSPAAIHTAEVSYVFGNLGPNSIFGTSPSQVTAADTALSKTMRGFWVNFASTGNPNGAGLPSWPEYTGCENEFLNIGKSISSIPTPDLERFRFVRGLRSGSLLPRRWRHEFVDN